MAKEAQPDTSLLTTVQAALDTVKAMSTKVTGRATAIKQLEIAVMLIKDDATTKEAKSATATNDHSALDKKLDFIIDTLTNSKPKPNTCPTWAQVVAQPTITIPPECAIAIKERQKTEVTISIRSVDEPTKTRLNEMTDQEITEEIRTFLKNNQKDPNIIYAARKTNKQSLKIRSRTYEDTETIKNMDWTKYAPGTTPVKPQYGIVIHGASKLDVPIDATTLVTEEHVNREIETSNLKRFMIKTITPLRKHTKNPNAPTHSIVLQLSSSEEADECIMNGIFIGRRMHHVEKYMPQYQVKQCFNCYSYGHRANECSKKRVCGKCSGDDHETKACESPTARCVHCESQHAAWHSECPTRKHEIEKLEEQRARQSPYFTQ